MFYQIQRIKSALQQYLRERKTDLKGESKQFSSVEEAYRAGFLRGFWEGAGTAVNHNTQKEPMTA